MSLSHALIRFHRAHTAFLTCAELVRSELVAAADDLKAERPRGRRLRMRRAELRLVGAAPDAPAEIKLIQEIVAGYYRMSVGLLFSEQRDDRTATARFVAMYLCRQLTKYSTGIIGRSFARDHTLLLYAQKSIGDRRSLNPEFEVELKSLREKCRRAIAGKFKEAAGA